MNEEKKLREKIEEQFAICGECEKTCKPKCRAVRVNAVLALFTPTPGDLISDEEQTQILEQERIKRGFIWISSIPEKDQRRLILAAQARHTAQLKEGEIRELKWTLKLIELIANSTAVVPGLALEEIKCALRKGDAYSNNFKDGDTPEEAWQGELEAIRDSQ